MAADLQLAPGTALELEQMALQAGAWQLTQTDQPLFGADRFDLSMVQQERPVDYRIRVQAQGFAPKGEIRRLLQVRRDQPEHFEALSLEADVRFDTPWDRRALELRRPQPRHIALSLAELRWGEIQFRATGDLNLDEAGWVSGELALQMENWRVLLDMLEKSRLLPSQSTRQGLEHLLELLAGLSGHPQKLNAKLRFQDGQAYAGPIPLGPAPRLVLR